MAQRNAEPFRIGVISDTHGLLRPQALAALRGVDHILHAGDVGNEEILEKLRAVAPLTAIRGNIDTHGACSLLPPSELMQLGDRTFYMLHDRLDLDLNPSAAGIAAVISGHSHQPLIERSKGVLYFNPGSAGPRRFSLPVTIGQIRIAEGELEAEIVPLPL